MLRALCFDTLRELFSAIPLSIAMTACLSNNKEAIAKVKRNSKSKDATRYFLFMIKNSFSEN
jgi:hypothetical protein